MLGQVKLSQGKLREVEGSEAKNGWFTGDLLVTSNDYRPIQELKKKTPTKKHKKRYPAILAGEKFLCSSIKCPPSITVSVPPRFPTAPTSDLF